MSISEDSWKIIDKNHHNSDNSDWIEEEERLLNWSENPIFEKQPLAQIAIRFIYVNEENSIVGSINTSIELEIHDTSSILGRSGFFDKVTRAKTPKTIFQGSALSSHSWLDKTYKFEDVAIYSIPKTHEYIDELETTTTFIPLRFSNDIAKIPTSLLVFHDLYEIVVILKEHDKMPILKSVLKKKQGIGKTKKVRISDDSPTEFVYSNAKLNSNKRKTHKNI
jgi:hypothetical protein